MGALEQLSSGRRFSISMAAVKSPFAVKIEPMHLKKGSGFFNPYRHLKSCLAEGDEQALVSIYKAAGKENLVTGNLPRPPIGTVICVKLLYFAS